jgi:hypothetical protein
MQLRDVQRFSTIFSNYMTRTEVRSTNFQKIVALVIHDDESRKIFDRDHIKEVYRGLLDGRVLN